MMRLFLCFQLQQQVINDQSNNHNILEVLKACWRLGGIENMYNVWFQRLEEFMHKGVIANLLKILSASNDGLQSCVCTNPHKWSCAQFFAQKIIMTRYIFCRKNMQAVVIICVPYANLTLINLCKILCTSLLGGCIIAAGDVLFSSLDPIWNRHLEERYIKW